MALFNDLTHRPLEHTTTEANHFKWYDASLRRWFAAIALPPHVKASKSVNTRTYISMCAILLVSFIWYFILFNFVCNLNAMIYGKVFITNQSIHKHSHTHIHICIYIHTQIHPYIDRCIATS